MHDWRLEEYVSIQYNLCWAGTGSSKLYVETRVAIGIPRYNQVVMTTPSNARVDGYDVLRYFLHVSTKIPWLSRVHVIVGIFRAPVPIQ